MAEPRPMTFGKTILASSIGACLTFVLLGTLVVGIFVSMIVGALSTEEEQIADRTMIELDLSKGVVEYPRDDPFGALSGGGEGSITVRRAVDALEAAAGDDRVRGVIVRVSDYTGGWSTAEELFRSLRRFAAEGKPVIAWIGETGCTEAAYMVASAADSIMMHPAGGLEMNGIAAQLTFFKPLLENIGVEAQVVRAGSYKSAVEPFLLDSASPESEEMTRSIVDGIFSRFRAAVAERRRIAPERLTTLLDSTLLLTPTEALRERLVDGVMYDDELQALTDRISGRDDGETESMAGYARAALGEESAADGQIAVVYAVGNIVSGKSGFSPSPLFGGENIGSETFVEAMRRARESSRIKGVVLRIESPGGRAAASEAMWREIMLTRKVKPVIVSMGSVAASGGYYIAAAADTIVADSTTLTGSIGVFGLTFNARELFEEHLGINTQSIESNPHADLMSITRPMTDFERKVLANQVDSIYQRFLTLVAEGRRISIDSVRRIAEGRVWTGAQAKAIGLVDEIGGLDRALEIAALRAGVKPGYGVRVLPEPKTFLEEMLQGMNTAVDLGRSRGEQEFYRTIATALEGSRGVQARAPGFVLK